MKTTSPFRASLPALALAALPCLSAHAQTPPMKPGLWEVVPESQTLDGKPMPGLPANMAEQLQRLPPEMRARVEEQMKAQGVQFSQSSTGATAIRMCITADMLSQNRWQGVQGRCEPGATRQSGSTWHWSVRCSEPPSEGEGSTTFDGSEAYRGSMRMTVTRQGKQQTVATTQRGRWLGSDCGGLKPLKDAGKP